MRTVVVALLITLVAPAAGASILGNKLARDVCGAGLSVTLLGADLAEYNAVDVIGGHENVSEYTFTHRLSAAATCRELSRVGMFAVCKNAPVTQTGNTLTRGSWADASC